MLTGNGLVVEHKEQIVPMESIDNLPRVSCKGHNMLESMLSSGEIDGMNKLTVRNMATVLYREFATKQSTLKHGCLWGKGANEDSYGSQVFLYWPV